MTITSLIKTLRPFLTTLMGFMAKQWAFMAKQSTFLTTQMQFPTNPNAFRLGKTQKPHGVANKKRQTECTLSCAVPLLRDYSAIDILPDTERALEHPLELTPRLDGRNGRLILANPALFGSGFFPAWSG